MGLVVDIPKLEFMEHRKALTNLGIGNVYLEIQILRGIYRKE